LDRDDAAEIRLLTMLSHATYWRAGFPSHLRDIVDNLIELGFGKKARNREIGTSLPLHTDFSAPFRFPVRDGSVVLCFASGAPREIKADED